MSVKRVASIALVAGVVVSVTVPTPTRAVSSSQGCDSPGLTGGVTAQALHASSAASGGGGPVGGPFQISDVASYDALRPSVAYNSQRDEYLVVWWNDRPVNDEIQGQRVSSGGELIGPPFFIAAGPGGTRRWPDVAYNKQHDEYLVVWETDWHVQARRVAGVGGAVGAEVTIAVGGTGVGYYDEAAVAYANTADRYVVVFRHVQWPPVAYGIYFDVREWDLTPVVQALVQPHSPSALPEVPDLAYNRTRNELLVVWQELVFVPSANYGIFGRRLRMAGPAVPGPLGAAFAIASKQEDETEPAVAAIPKPAGVGEYMVVYEIATSSTTRAIAAQRVAGDSSTLLGLPLAISDPYLSPPQDCTDPSVAANGAANRYLVVWTNDYPASTGIRGQAVSSGGELLGDRTAIGGHSADNAAVAGGPLSDFLVALDDYDSGKYSVSGRLWGNRVYVPLILRN
jgi:hypothetical protein